MYKELKKNFTKIFTKNKKKFYKNIYKEKKNLTNNKNFFYKEQTITQHKNNQTTKKYPTIKRRKKIKQHKK